MITLTEDEAAALHQIIAGLATIGERGFENDRQVCEVSWLLWQDMFLKPARRLQRVGSNHRIPGNKEVSE